MKVQVQYDVPISAIVDTATGEVEDVIVWCEGVEQRDGEHVVVLDETQAPASAAQRDRALEIADSAVWPAWEMG